MDDFTKTTIACIGLMALAVGGPVVADSITEETCEIKYDMSFNGLYIIKQRVCYAGFTGFASRTEIARRPRFDEF